MPKPLYFYPYTDDRYYIGFGPRFLANLPAGISLHCIAPTLARKKFKYAHELEANAFARYTDNTHRIYVMGHCGPGRPNIHTSTGNRNGTCHFTQLVSYFEDYGLPDTSQVVIRIHACHSASPNGVNDSFAKRFKDQMTLHNYNAVTVQGYTVAIGPYLVNRWGELPFSSANEHRVTVA
ncbi:MAG: hypothetical protein QM776_15555 [Rhodocyclaceae bacterium]